MADLVLDELEVKYGDVTAVRRVSLHVGEGEFVTLLGPSGCGKTTTLRAVAGLEQCSGGRISIGGEVVAGPGTHVPPERRDINMVFQTYAVWPHMTVFDNVAFGLRVRRAAKSEVKERVDDALKLVGLSPYAGRYATELSGGQQQRVALARAVVTRPRLLLFDEPLSNLDATLREQMRFEIRDLHDRIGKTAVYVTHDQSEAMVMSDRVVLMNAGRIEQVGSPQDLYERPATRFAAEFLGVANLWNAVIASTGSTLEPGTVELREAGRPPLSVAICGLGSHPAGAVGTVAVRSERLAVSLPGGDLPTGNSWTGEIVSVEYLGARLETRIRLAEGRTVRADALPSLGIRPGDPVVVGAAPDAFVWIPEQKIDEGEPEAETGQRQGFQRLGRRSAA